MLRRAAVKRLTLLAAQDFGGLAVLFALSSLPGQKNVWLIKTLEFR